MKKKLIALLVVVALVFSALFVLTACDKTKAITIWVSELDGVKTMTETQVAAFMEAHPEYEGYKITVQGVSEGDAASNMITDVKTGADIYCFAQDQLGRLIEANALSRLGNAGQTAVKLNDDGAVAAVTLRDSATQKDEMYAYPITSDNTYFMYYDKTVVSDEHVGDLNAIIEDCENDSKNISFEVGGSAWYTASFFFGAGATSKWTLDPATKKWTATDTFNSDKGLIALEGLQMLTKSAAWVNSSKTSDFTAATPSAVVISGTWGATDAQKALGDNLGVAKLPSYTVGEQSYQLTSFMGYKLMGVKNHEDADVHAFCHELAIYLSGKACQKDRLDEFTWGPSNKELQASTAVTENDILKAVHEQSLHSVLQGQIHGGWWDFAKLLGSKSKDAEATTEGRQALLDEYTQNLNKYEQMTEEEMNAFTVIGSIASLNGKTSTDDANIINGPWVAATWTGDYKMVEDPEGTWTSAKALVLAEGDQFKVRKGQSWDTAYGQDGENFVVETAGTYFIKLVISGENGTVTLVPAE